MAVVGNSVKRNKNLSQVGSGAGTYFAYSMAWYGRILILAVCLCITGLVMHETIQDAHALVPSLHEDEGDVVTPTWTHILQDGEGTEDDPGCKSNTTSEMPIGQIFAIILSAGVFGAIPILVGLVVAAGALLAASVNIIEGIKVACPVKNPEYPTEAAYWDRAWKDRIVFRYSPCIGLLDAGETFYSPRSDGTNSGNTSAHYGEAGGYVCIGFRIGDSLQVWDDDTTRYLEGAVLGTTRMQDKICLYVHMGITRLQLVCQYLKPRPRPLPPAMACFMPKVCGDNDYSKSLYSPGVTARVVQCVEGSVRALFQDGYRREDGTYYPEPISASDRNADCPTTALIYKFQQNFKRAVTGALTLFIIFYGIKIMFGGQQALTKNEFMVKMITFAMVSYFAIGDGWKEFYPMLLTVSNSLAGMVLDSASGGFYCNFPLDGYPDGFQNLRLWDTLDCKVFTYFTVDQDYPKIFSVAFYAFFGGGIVILLFAVLMVIFFVAIVLFVLQVYLASVIGMTLLVFLSPIFVPMVLFGPTKKYFEGWLNSILSFALYPVILFGFLALILITLDMFYWGEPKIGDAESRNPQNYWRYAPDPDVAAYRCKNTGSAYLNLNECRQNCTHSECYIDPSTITLPSDGLWLCPATFHTFEGAGALARCNDQCYREVDVANAKDSAMDPALLPRLSTAYDPPRLYRACVSGNYKPEFKARCNAEPDGPLYLTKEICELPENCPGECSYQCDPSTFGCQLYRAEYGDQGDDDEEAVSVDNFSMGTALLALLKVLGIGILVYYYLAVLGPTIAELTGTHKQNISKLASNPQMMMKGMMSVTTGALSGVTSMGKGKKAAQGIQQIKGGLEEMDKA